MEWDEKLGSDTVVELQCIESMLLDKMDVRTCEAEPGVELHLRMTPNSGQDQAREFVRATLVIMVRPNGARPSVRVCDGKGLDDVQLRSLERLMSDMAGEVGRETLLICMITAFQDALDDFNTQIGDCSVCLDELCVANADVVRTPCFHRLHTGCLGAHWLHSLVAQIELDASLGHKARSGPDWCAATIVCPVCRSTLAAADLAVLCGSAHVTSVRAAVDAALMASRHAEADDGSTERYRAPDPSAAHSAGFEVISNRIGHADDSSSEDAKAASQAGRRGQHAVVVSNVRCGARDEAACHAALGVLAARHDPIGHAVLHMLPNGSAVAEVYFATARAADTAAAALNGCPCGESVVWAGVRRRFDDTERGHSAPGMSESPSKGRGGQAQHKRGDRAAQSQQPLCKYYARGACTAGEDCRFRHQRHAAGGSDGLQHEGPSGPAGRDSKRTELRSGTRATSELVDFLASGNAGAASHSGPMPGTRNRDANRRPRPRAAANVGVQ